MNCSLKKIQIKYFAALREDSGLSSEYIETELNTPLELYKSLKEKYNFSLQNNQLRVAVNEKFCSMDHEIKNGDTIVFIPPVAGG